MRKFNCPSCTRNNVKSRLFENGKFRTKSAKGDKVIAKVRWSCARCRSEGRASDFYFSNLGNSRILVPVKLFVRHGGPWKYTKEEEKKLEAQASMGRKNEEK